MPNSFTYQSRVSLTLSVSTAKWFNVLTFTIGFAGAEATGGVAFRSWASRPSKPATPIWTSRPLGSFTKIEAASARAASKPAFFSWSITGCGFLLSKPGTPKQLWPRLAFAPLLMLMKPPGKRT